MEIAQEDPAVAQAVSIASAAASRRSGRFVYHLVSAVALAYLVALYLIGYPLAIVTLLAMAATALTSLVVLTAYDLVFDRPHKDAASGSRR